jgi:hypothetical protein
MVRRVYLLKSHEVCFSTTGVHREVLEVSPQTESSGLGASASLTSKSLEPYSIDAGGLTGNARIGQDTLMRLPFDPVALFPR